GSAEVGAAHSGSTPVPVRGAQRETDGDDDPGEPVEPGRRGAHRAGAGQRPVGDGDGGPGRVAVGLGGAHPHLQALGEELHVGDVEGGQFAAAGHHREPEQAQGAVAQARQVVAGGLHHGAQLLHGQGGGAPRNMPGLGAFPAVGAQHHAGGFGVQGQAQGGVVGLDGAQDTVDGGGGGRRNGVGEGVDVGGEGGGGGGQGA